MKNLPAFLLVLLSSVFVAPSSKAQTNLASLGTNNFEVQVTLGMTPQQSATSLTNVPTINLGGLFGGSFTNINSDWSAYGDANIWTFGLFMSIAGPTVSVPFTVEIYDSAFDLINSYQGSTDGAVATPSFIAFDNIAQAGTDDFSSGGGFQLTWDGELTSAVIIDGVGVVPEPSTWALLGLSALTFAAIAWRRRSTVRRC